MQRYTYLEKLYQESVLQTCNVFNVPVCEMSMEDALKCYPGTDLENMCVESQLYSNIPSSVHICSAVARSLVNSGRFVICVAPDKAIDTDVEILYEMASKLNRGDIIDCTKLLVAVRHQGLLVSVKPDNDTVVEIQKAIDQSHELGIATCIQKYLTTKNDYFLKVVIAMLSNYSDIHLCWCQLNNDSMVEDISTKLLNHALGEVQPMFSPDVLRSVNAFYGKNGMDKLIRRIISVVGYMPTGEDLPTAFERAWNFVEVRNERGAC